MTLEIITADELSAHRHGFFTRRGGVSSGIFKGLNCGLGSSDQTEVVLKNRELVAESMNVPLSQLASVYQIHSADVIAVDGPTKDPVQKADAMVSATKGIAVGILTADCAPILFSDAENGVVGAAHSGWKGAISGISNATIEAMEALGAKRENIAATVGPCISQRNYEVGEEFFENFILEDQDFSRFFAQGAPQKFQFDLPGFCLHQLRQAGVESANWTGHCTYEDEDRFYSYRRTTHKKEADYGRLISVIAP